MMNLDPAAADQRYAGIMDTVLPQIPLVDLDSRGPGALIDLHRDRAERLIASGRRMLTGPGLQAMEFLSRRWAERCKSPYFEEIRNACSRLPTGGWFMNMCYEWGCSTGVADDPADAGMRMLRTLDWPFHGLGREVVVVRHESACGPWYNVTWPGYLGAMTVMAPGRFAAAINQAPLRRRRWRPLAIDWLTNRVGVWRSGGLPPAHLLRRVCETCPDYGAAKVMLRDTELALPAFLTLAGVRRSEGCVIERLETAAYLHEAPAAVANHWLTAGLTGRPRGRDSAGRLRAMAAHCEAFSDGAAGMEWVVAPVLNPDTRLAVATNAATGRLSVQGWEADGPATQILDHTHAA